MDTKFITAIGLSLFLSGCANMQDRQQTQVEGALVGCGVGAVIGNVLGKDTRSTIAGCLAGGVAGGIYGDHVADQKEEYASREAHFEAVIENARKVRADAQEYNKQLSDDIAQVQSDINQLKDSSESFYKKNLQLYQQKQKTADLLKKTEQKLGVVRHEIDKQKSFLANNQEYVAPSIVKVSLQEISQLETENRTLEIALAELKVIDNRRIF